MEGNGIDIKGLDKAELLAALYNNSKPLGLGFLQADPNPMTKEEAAQIIREEGLGFDYLKGRVMKLNLGGDTLNPWGYDRDNGAGSAAKTVEGVRTGVISQPAGAPAGFHKGLDDLLASAKPSRPTAGGYELGIDDELKQALVAARRNFVGPKLT
jgi:hypothetical protein